MTVKQMFQCRLRRGDSETTAWIEARGAKVGVSVELLPAREVWDVVEVYRTAPLREDQLREAQQQRRGGLPSVGGKH